MTARFLSGTVRLLSTKMGRAAMRGSEQVSRGLVSEVKLALAP